MGLSSSQARLLSLTSRQHDIEYKAQHLEAQKLQMANESTQVYQEYENALNSTKVQYKTVGADGSATFVDATYNNMRDYGYQIKFKGDDRIPVDQATIDNYTLAAGDSEYFAALQSNRVSATSTNVGGVTEIYNVSQLQKISGSGSYRLMSDIDLTGKTWSSISSFYGRLNGNGHTISGLSSSLFSSLSGATVENLKLANVGINSSSTSVAALANYTYGTTNINNVSVSGSITSNSATYMAGVVGYNSGTLNMNNITSNANLTYTGTGESFIGGIIGSNTNNLSINNAIYNGSINALNTTNASAGGIQGLSQLGYSGQYNKINNVSTTGTINNNTNNGTKGSGGISGTGWAISANLSNNIISNSSSSMSVSGNLNVGGLAGFLEGTVTNSVYSGTITATTNAGGIVGKLNGGSINNTLFTGSGNPNGSIVGYIDSGRGASTISNSSSSNTSLNEIGTDSTSTTTTDTNSAASNVTSLCTSSGSTNSINTVVDNTGADAARTLFASIQKYGYILEGTGTNNVGTHGDDPIWFSNMLNAGEIYLYRPDANAEGGITQTNIATDTNLQEVSDDTQLKKAEAKYEADMRKIDAKDKKFDTDLAALETERNAIKTEVETLKTVAKDNVDRTFKLFS